NQRKAPRNSSGDRREKVRTWVVGTAGNGRQTRLTPRAGDGSQSHGGLPCSIDCSPRVSPLRSPLLSSRPTRRLGTEVGEADCRVTARPADGVSEGPAGGTRAESSGTSLSGCRA